MKNRYITLILIALFAQPLFAQEAGIFTGKVIDAETKEPVPLATIRSQSVYTATNIEGEYDIAPKHDNERITFSHISYHTKQIDFKNLPAVIELKPKTIELSEIVVLPHKTIIRNLKAVWNKYASFIKGKKDKDFPQQTFYYRQLTENDNNYTEYMECFFKALTFVGIRNMSLQEGRYAKAKKDSIFNVTNFFYFLQTTPYQSWKALYKNATNAFLCADFEEHYNIHIDKVISIGQDDEVIVYSFTPNRPFDLQDNYGFMAGKLYIRSKDNAIIRAECKGNFGFKSMTIEKQEYEFIITYRDGIAPYPIVETVQGNSQIIWKLGDSSSKHETHINSILVATENVFGEKSKKGKKVGIKNNLLNEVAQSKYNEEFWDNNPVVKRTKVEQKVLEDFKRLGYFGTMKLDGEK